MFSRPPLGFVPYVLSALLAASANGQVLYSQNFDLNDTNNWTINNNGSGTNAADVFFDYGTVGIPPAPNSGGTTRGLKLAANLNPNTSPGLQFRPALSVSPTGKHFEGNYTLRFDLWSNYIGHFPSGVGFSAAGSTMLSTYGILTSGTVANYAGAADGVFFANTGDGGSTLDYRAYSSERPANYLSPPVVPEDAHATYHAGGQDNTAMLYSANFGGVAVPAAQAALYPETQHGTTPLGSLGFQWHEVEIAKVGTTVTWKVDGILLVTVETAGFTIPTGGTNILFGHSDVNNTASPDPYYPLVSFTLIDNIRVTRLGTAQAGDFDSDGDVDGDDHDTFEACAAGPALPYAPGCTLPPDGSGFIAADFDQDGDADAEDFGIFQRCYSGSNIPAVPGCHQ